MNCFYIVSIRADEGYFLFRVPNPAGNQQRGGKWNVKWVLKCKMLKIMKIQKISKIRENTENIEITQSHFTFQGHFTFQSHFTFQAILPFKAILHFKFQISGNQGRRNAKQEETFVRPYNILFLYNIIHFSF